MFDNVLVPTDGSDCAEVAVGYANDLATRYGATVHALSVADSRLIETGPHSDRLRERCEETAGEVCDYLSTEGLQVEKAVRTDLPHRAILEYVADHDIDLVVMGTHGRTGVERYLLGSVTEKVVRLSDVPVLTVREADGDDARYPYDDVLVPTDGSEAAAAAVDPAVDIAHRYGARLHALSVVDQMAMGVDVRSEAVMEALEDSARSALDAVEERAIGSSVSAVETTVEYGNPFREIRSYVTEHDIDLIVMGTHGRDSIERYLLGSVTEKLVRTSSAPVMTVRMPDSAES